MVRIIRHTAKLLKFLMRENNRGDMDANGASLGKGGKRESACQQERVPVSSDICWALAKKQGRSRISRWDNAELPLAVNILNQRTVKGKRILLN